MPLPKISTRYLLCCVLFLTLAPFAQSTFAQAPLPKPQLVLATGHSGGISSIVYAPDGKSFVTSGDDNTVKKWDAATNSLTRLLSDDVWVSELAFSPDGKLIAGAQKESPKIRFWNAASGKVRADVDLPELAPEFTQSINSIAFSPDGKTLAVGTGTQMVTPGAQVVAPEPNAPSLRGHILLLDTKTRKVIWNVVAHEEMVQAVGFSPDGKIVASSGGDYVWKFWDAAMGSLKTTLPSPLPVPAPLFRTGPHLSTLAFSPDGKLLATSGTYGEQTTIWDVATAKPLRTLPVNSRRLAFMPDNKTLVVGQTGYAIEMWDATSGKQIKEVGHPQDSQTAMVLSPDGKTVLSGSGWSRDVRVWDVAAAKERDPVVGMVAPGYLAFSADGHLLAAGSVDGTVKVWNLSQGRLRRTVGRPGNLVERVNQVAFAPDNRTLAVVRDNVQIVYVWDVESGRQRYRISQVISSLTQMAMSPDGKLIATANGEKKEKVGEVKLWDAATGEVLRTFPALTAIPTSVTFSPDNKALATLESNGNKVAIKIWDVESAELRSTFPGSYPRRGKLLYSPDGKTLAVGSYNESVILIDAQTGALLRRVNVPLSRFSFTFSPDGQSILIGQRGGEVKICDVATGDATMRWTAHLAAISHVAFSPAGNRIATASTDGTIKLWRVSDQRLLATFAVLATQWKDGKGSTDWIVFTPSGDYAASTKADQYIRWRVGEKLLPAATYKKEHFLPEKVKKALQ